MPRAGRAQRRRRTSTSARSGSAVAPRAVPPGSPARALAAPPRQALRDPRPQPWRRAPRSGSGPSIRETSLQSAVNGALRQLGRATSTASRPGGGLVAAAAARSRRFALLRSTAEPTRLPATTATRGSPSPRSSRWTSTCAPCHRRRRASTWRMSLLPRSRCTTRASDLTVLARRSHREALAALGPSPRDRGLAPTRAHAGSESVPAVATAVLGLVRALHRNARNHGGRGLPHRSGIVGAPDPGMTPTRQASSSVSG